MKTNTQNTLISIPHFEGIVVDQETGRKCALQRDIAAGLGLSDSQVILAKGSVYQGRFLDVLDVINNRAAGKGRGRPRKKPRGMILTEVVAAIVAMTAAVTLLVPTLSQIRAELTSSNCVEKKLETLNSNDQ